MHDPRPSCQPVEHEGEHQRSSLGGGGVAEKQTSLGCTAGAPFGLGTPSPTDELKWEMWVLLQGVGSIEARAKLLVNGGPSFCGPLPPHEFATLVLLW